MTWNGDDRRVSESQQKKTLMRIEGKIDAIDKILRGNGKPGLIMQVDRLERIHVNEDKQRNRKWDVVLAFIGGGGIITGINIFMKLWI